MSGHVLTTRKDTYLSIGYFVNIIWKHTLLCHQETIPLFVNRKLESSPCYNLGRVHTCSGSRSGRVPDPVHSFV